MDFSESDDRTCSSLVNFSRFALIVDVHKWVFSRDRASTSVYLHDGEAFFIHSVFRCCSVTPFVCSNVKRDLRRFSQFFRSLPPRHYFASFPEENTWLIYRHKQQYELRSHHKVQSNAQFSSSMTSTWTSFVSSKRKMFKALKTQSGKLNASIELICTSVETNEKVKCAHKSASRSQSLLVKLLEIRRNLGKMGKRKHRWVQTSKFPAVHCTIFHRTRLQRKLQLC